MNRSLSLLILFSVTLFMGSAVRANHIRMPQAPVLDRSRMGENILSIQLDLNWDNSWNYHSPMSHDAAWVFVKYKKNEDPWKHGSLKATGHTCGTGSTDVTFKVGKTDSKIVGVFISRSQANTYGNVQLNDLTLLMDLIGTGITNSSTLSVAVYAMEMVYIPQGAFEIGDRASSARFMKYGQTLTTQYSSANAGYQGQILNAPSADLLSAFSNDVSPQGTLSASSVNGSNSAYQAWDHSNTQAWQSAAGSGWHWIQYTCLPGQTLQVDWMLLSVGQLPTSIDGLCIRGSYDGHYWTDLYGDTLSTDETVLGHRQYTPIQCQRSAPYTAYRIYFHASNDVEVYDIRMYGSGGFANQIQAESALTLLKSDDGTTLTMGAEYPKGYQGFYVMKYEVTQGAYVAFLNTLSKAQQVLCSTLSPDASAGTMMYPGTRSMIRIETVAGPNTPAKYGCSVDGTLWDSELNGSHLPMFSCSWSDMSAFLDWAALRPLSELEYEKASRGTQAALPKAFAWGSKTFINSTGVNNKNRYDEVATPFDAHAVERANALLPSAIADSWPIRVGALSNATGERLGAGASTYGVLNLSDNVPELYIQASDAVGLAFKGIHGDGELDAQGHHNCLSWPTYNASTGLIHRGVAVKKNGTQYTLTKLVPISDRSESVSRLYERDGFTGIRGGRTAE